MPDLDTILEQRPTVRGPNALVIREPDMKWLDIPREQLLSTLGSSLYPGAKPASIAMVLDYCEAAGLNVMLKPVHIVPMNVKKPGGGNNYEWRDVIMPGINHYRTQASRTGTYMGKTEAEFGPDVAEKFGGAEYVFPEWCRITVKRLVGSHVAEFTATEYWKENFATAGRDKPQPNAMWSRRPRGQLAKCTEAQALRMAFPELVSDATAEEMEGKIIDLEVNTTAKPVPAAARKLDNFAGSRNDEGPVEGEPTDQTLDEHDGDGVILSDEVPTIPAKALKAWVEKQDWKAGWKWLNEVFPGLTQAAKQELANTHNAMLWEVYRSDADKKGPQSKAALAFTEDHGITVPPVVSPAAEQDSTDDGPA